MSFRALPENPILQRLRKASIEPAQSQASVLSVTSLEESHTISDYGCLSAPHSFAHEPHEIRQRRDRRRSSAARQPQTESHGVTDGKERKISLMPAPIPKSSTAEIEGPMSTASSISQHININAPLITGRPREGEPAEDDCVDAVILKAKWESFTRAPAREIQVSQRKKKL